jgi:hypothetical protein
MRTPLLSAAIRPVLALLLLVGISHALDARLVQHWTYQEMFDKSDLVAIGNLISSRDTDERITLPGYNPALPVIGVVTEFKTSIVFKGPKDLKTIRLHHYRFVSKEEETAMSNRPELVKIPTGQYASFLLFLVKEQDGKYAPVTGQTDPALYSVLDLLGAAD